MIEVGARPLFVVDGEPPALKKAVQEKRSRQCSQAWTLFESEWENSSQRSFNDKVEECVAMLDYLGIPVIRAEGEAESLCAELDRKGLVDFCVTPDSDAFVHGAKHVIKNLQALPKDPLVELYQATDIKEKLCLHQRHLLALALLVGCDYTEGVPGVGFQSALRLVQCFSEDEILDRLRAWGKGELPSKAEIIQPCDGDEDNEQIVLKYTHCSKCGHHGNKRNHKKFGCQTCTRCTDEDWTNADLLILGCTEKPKGFRCTCHVCTARASQNEKTRSSVWWTKICCKLAATPGFPNEDIIDIFLKPEITISEDPESFTSTMAQHHPNMKQLEGFLQQNLHWDASYTRRKTLPLLSHFCLVELAAKNSSSPTQNLTKGLINNLYRPCYIERVKIDHSERLFLLKWETVNKGGADVAEQWLGMESPLTIATNENIDLVRAACPELARVFDEAQMAKQERLTKKPKRNKSGAVDEKQSKISSHFQSEHASNIGKGRTPEEHVSIGLSLDSSAAASSPCDVMDESHPFFRLGPDLKNQESGSSLAATSPLIGSPDKMLRRKALSRKLTFL